MSDRSHEGRCKLIALIERELRKERRRGLAGDRAYDVTRHANLVRLLKEERDDFRAAAYRVRGAATKSASTPARC